MLEETVEAKDIPESKIFVGIKGLLYQDTYPLKGLEVLRELNRDPTPEGGGARAFEIIEGDRITRFIIHKNLVYPINNTVPGGIAGPEDRPLLFLHSPEEMPNKWGTSPGTLNSENNIISFPNGMKMDISLMDFDGSEGYVIIKTPEKGQGGGKRKKKSQSNRKRKSQSNRKRKSQSNRKKKSKKRKSKKKKSY